MSISSCHLYLLIGCFNWQIFSEHTFTVNNWMSGLLPVFHLFMFPWYFLGVTYYFEKCVRYCYQHLAFLKNNISFSARRSLIEPPRGLSTSPKTPPAVWSWIVWLWLLGSDFTGIRFRRSLVQLMLLFAACQHLGYRMIYVWFPTR